jgi:hypothetical protein
MADFPVKNDRVSTAVELGPRALALLRRICRALEILADDEVADPGKRFEDNDQLWPDGE